MAAVQRKLHARLASANKLLAHSEAKLKSLKAEPASDRRSHLLELYELRRQLALRSREMLQLFASTAIAPHERGVEFGRAHRDEIARTTARYRALFVRRGPAGFDATPWARRFREVIGDLHPASLAEMAGIAEGAGVDQLDVVAVNARTEILAKADPRGERECSTVAVVPPTGSPFGAQTWDWYAAMADESRPQVSRARSLREVDRVRTRLPVNDRLEEALEREEG